MKLRRSILLLLLAGILLAAYLGFADIKLPHDKLFHYVIFLILTCLFYWLIDTQTTRAITQLSLIICTFGGGIGSECIQALTPYREFDILDIVANIMGSLTGLAISVYYHRKLIDDKRKKKYDQIRNSVPPEIVTEDASFDMDLESGAATGTGSRSSSSSTRLNDLSRFTSAEHFPLKNVDPEPIDNLEVD